MTKWEMAKNLVEDYNKDPDKFDENQAKKIAQIAFHYEIEFKPKTKAMKKFLFDMADTAVLGLIPNEMRPETVGEDLFGESTGEKFAGGAGTILGLVHPAMWALKGGRAIKGMDLGDKATTMFAKGYIAGKAGARSAWKKTKAGSQSLMDLLKNKYNRGWSRDPDGYWQR